MDGRGTCPEEGCGHGGQARTKYKKFPEEYRDETADYVISTGKPVKAATRELGIAETTLNDWVKRGRAELSAVPIAVQTAPTKVPGTLSVTLRDCRPDAVGWLLAPVPHKGPRVLPPAASGPRRTADGGVLGGDATAS